jgi:hypothetical protein
MKKIIPFKKDIIFKTNLSEITSISLEHTLKTTDHQVNGTFTVSGEYKITEASINTESFSYDLPFNINFDDKYKLDDAVVDIDDFYYEIINDNVLSVNIETSVDKIEEILVEEPLNEIAIQEIREEEPIIETEVKKERCIEEEENVKNLFDNISGEDTYKTYKIYIVRENDTIENIMMKYEINKEELELYNDLSEIKLGDKIIIPACNEGN